MLKSVSKSFCVCHENEHVKNIPVAPHYLYLSFKLASLYCGRRFILGTWFVTHTGNVACRWNRLNEPILKEKSWWLGLAFNKSGYFIFTKSSWLLLTEFGIHHRLESKLIHLSKSVWVYKEPFLSQDYEDSEYGEDTDSDLKTVDLETDMDGAESISSTAIPAEVDKTSPPQPKLRIGIVLPKRIFKRRQYREVISRTLSQVLQNEHCLTKSQAKSIFLCILYNVSRKQELLLKT